MKILALASSLEGILTFIIPLVIILIVLAILDRKSVV